MSNYVYASHSHGLAGKDALAAAIEAKRASFSPKQLQEGRSYMTSQWRQMGVAASKTSFKPATAVKQADGKVAVPISNFWSDWNKEAAKALRPVMRVLRNLELPKFIDKRKLETRPLDFVLDIFDPVLNRIEAACVRTQQKHVPRGRVQWFGKTIDIRIDQPGDDRMDVSTRNLVRTLRTIQSFILLFFTKPLELAGECLKEGFDVAGDTMRDVSNAVDKTLKEAGKAAETVAKETEVAVAAAAAAAPASAPNVTITVPGGAGPASTSAGLPSYALPLIAVAALGIGFAVMRK